MTEPRELTPREIELLRLEVRREAQRLVVLIMFQMTHEVLRS